MKYSPEIKITAHPHLKQDYRLRLTPGVKTMLDILSMPLVRLKEYIEKEAEENPLLDTEPPLTSRKISISGAMDNMDAYKGSLATRPLSLHEYLMLQIRTESVPEEISKAAEHIIGNLDEDGYLQTPIEEISNLYNIDMTILEKALSLVQRLDPPGTGARDIKECLLIQLKEKGETNSLQTKIITHFFRELEERDYEKIARRLKVSLKEVQKAIHKIIMLEPKPGRQFTGKEGVNTNIISDASIIPSRKSFEIKLNYSELPILRINPRYLQMIKDKNTPCETKAFLKRKLQSAIWLLHAIKKRQETTKKVLTAIANAQKKALRRGLSNIAPLKLEDIAKRCGIHPSTVSRIISRKYVQTPFGSLKLKDLFSKGLYLKNGKTISSRSIQEKIKHIIQKEDPERPYTDLRIAELLDKRYGINLQRRTITKYRQASGIMPAYLRKRKSH